MLFWCFYLFIKFIINYYLFYLKLQYYLVVLYQVAAYYIYIIKLKNILVAIA